MAQDLIVFSHIRWHESERRPQQIIRRLAAEGRVFYLEEPLQREHPEPHLEVQELLPNLFLCQPQTPERVVGFHETQLPYLDHLLAQLIEDYGIDDWVAWFYTPTAEPLMHDYQPLAVVYDCMGELHGRLHRPGKAYLPEREVDLLQAADLVFTDSSSVQRALQGKHDQVFCFLDGVDQAHFRPVQPPPEPPQQASLPHPRLGYFGSLDRRLDRELLATLAAAHPDWQLVMIGPVTHLEDEEALPQAPNIHYPGPEKFGDLPAFMSHWDLCILPWVCNEATQWASPVRLLEFLATEKPVVSTPIAGLTDQLTPLLYLADSPDAFIRACEQALVETAEAREQRLTGVRQVLEEGRWERTVPRMQQLLQQAVAQNRQRRTRRPAVSTPIPAATRRT